MPSRLATSQLTSMDMPIGAQALRPKAHKLDESYGQQLAAVLLSSSDQELAGAELKMSAIREHQATISEI